MRIKDVKSGYVVVLKRYYDKYKNNSYFDRWCDTLEEAKYIRDSLERNDLMSFLIIDGTTKEVIE